MSFQDYIHTWNILTPLKLHRANTTFFFALAAVVTAKRCLQTLKTALRLKVT